MRRLDIREAMNRVGRVPVRCSRGDGILKAVAIPDSQFGGDAMTMATVARHHGPDVEVPLRDVWELEAGDHTESGAELSGLVAAEPIPAGSPIQIDECGMVRRAR